MAYSLDFRKRAMALRAEGWSVKKISITLGVGTNTINDWSRREQTGNLAVFYPKTRRRKIDDDALKQAVKDNPEVYLQELSELFGVTETGIYHAMKRLGITRKKRLHNTANATKKNGKSTSKP
jgi:transposase